MNQFLDLGDIDDFAGEMKERSLTMKKTQEAQRPKREEVVLDDDDILAQVDDLLEAGSQPQIQTQTQPEEEELQRPERQILTAQFEGEASMPSGGVDDSLSAVDDLIGQMQQDEGSLLANETDLIVNWDSVTNCLIDFVAVFCKTFSGSLSEQDKSEMTELANYYVTEVKTNYEKFPFWLSTLDNDNVVTLHTSRNQTKESAESLAKNLASYNSNPDQKNQRMLLNKVQTAVADCWCFYEAVNVGWSYDSVMFGKIEALVKTAKRLFAAAKCESGEDWVSVCLDSLNSALVTERNSNFVSYSKKSLPLQMDISNCSVMLAKIIKRAQLTGDEHRRLPVPKTRHLLENLSKAFVQQVKILHGKLRTPASEPKPVVYTNEVMAMFSNGYKTAAKSVLESIDAYTNTFGSSLDVDVQELIELGEYISKHVGKMADLFRALPVQIVSNIMPIVFNVSKMARIIVKWAELESTDSKTRDLLLSTMQTALHYSIQAKCLSCLKAVAYPILEIESSLFTASRFVL